MMRKMIVIAAALLVAATLFGATAVYAQTQTPPEGAPATGWTGMRGMMARGGGMMGGGMMRAQDGTGFMHDDMVEAFAAELGLTVDEINTRLAAGETMYQIAESAGLTAEEIQAVMTAAHTQALAEAVADGTITQEQADWMTQRMAQRSAQGFGPGSGNCTGAGPTGTGPQGGMMGGRGFRGGRGG